MPMGGAMSDQLSLLLPPQTPARVRTRTGDPETSLLAAASVDMRRKYVEVLSLLATLPKPVTYHDLIDAPNYGRLTELNRAGLIEEAGVQGGPRRGRLWAITARGREAVGA